MTAVPVEPPEPELTVTAVEPEWRAAVPSLRFAVEAADESGREVYTVALTTHVQIDADRRSYDPESRARLLDLFGEDERIPQTAGPLKLARVETLVPAFSGSVQFELEVPVSGDLELAAARYLASLSGGAVPLTFLFNGRIFYRGAADRLQVTLVPWSSSARFRLPVATWRDLIERRYAACGFVRLQADTVDALRRRRAELGLPTFDATIAEALR
jgi:hypothetical protein